MKKNYSRNKTGSFAILGLGIIIIVSVLIQKNFVLRYDGFFLSCALLMLISSLWGIFSPIALIEKNKLTLKLSLIKIKTIDLAKTREIGFDKNRQLLKFDQTEFNLKLVDKEIRDRFVADLKLTRERLSNK